VIGMRERILFNNTFVNLDFGLEICGLLGYYAASCGNCLPTFRDNVSVPSSRVKSPSGKNCQGKKPVGIYRRSLEDNTFTNVKYVGLD
jgi:hypothetical protein